MTRSAYSPVRRLTLGLVALLAAVGVWLPAADAAEADLDNLLAPLIALEARIPLDASTAPTLGAVRRGTGVVIDGNGLVVTVGYLILEAESVVLLPEGPDGEQIPADVIAWDHNTGFGLLRARAPLHVRAIALGDSAALGTGKPVVIASWQQRDGWIPAVVFDVGPFAGFWEYLLEDAIYVVPMHPGFAGAALLDMDGALLGIGGFAYVNEEAEIGANVFLPINLFKDVLADLLVDGHSAARRPWLGLYCGEADGRLVVRGVRANGPAAAAGLRELDEIVSVNGEAVAALEPYLRALWRTAAPGDTVRIVVRRDGVEQIHEVIAAERNAQARAR